jgi:DNA processing protein
VKPVRQETFSLAGYEPDEQLIIRTLLENNKQLTMDEISWKTNLAISKVASLLLTLEFKGLLAALPGRIFKFLK